MRAAPPVDAALDAGRRERMLTVLLHLLTGLALAAWAALQAELASLLAWAGAVAAALAMAAVGERLARRAWPDRPARLRWDGRQWLAVDAVAGLPVQQPLGRVVVALDLGVWMLLQLHPADGARPVWRVASARGAQAAWHGLRLALAAHAGAPAAADGPGDPT